MAKKPQNQTVTRIVKFEGDATSLNATLKSIQASSAAAATSLKRISSSVQKTNDSIKSFEQQMNSAGRMLKGFGALFVATEIARYVQAIVGLGISVVKASDQLKLMDVRLSRLGDGADNFATIADLADKLGTNIEDLADNVALLSPAFQKMGLSFGNVADFTEGMIKSMRVFGTDARRAQIVTVQLAQALSSGQFQGDELRSLSENAGGLALELERVVQKMLGTKLSLRELGAAGELSAQVIMVAFAEVFKNLQNDMSKLPVLFDQNLARMENAWLRVKSAIEKAIEASKAMQSIMQWITNQMNQWAISQGSLEVINESTTQDAAERLGVVSTRLSEIKTKLELMPAIDDPMDNINPFRIDTSGVETRITLEKEQNDLLVQRAHLLTKLETSRQQELKDAISAKALAESASKQIPGGADVVDKLTKALKLSEKAKENLATFLPTIAKAAEETGIRATTLIAKIYRESKFENFSAANSSARGPSQIIESTARKLSDQYNKDFEALRTGSDGWIQNIQAGALYLRDMMKNARSETEGMAKYFLGPGKVAEFGMDVTAGKNGGLTGRQYAENAFKTEQKIIDALEGTKLASEGAGAALDRFRDSFKGAQATQEQYQAAQNAFKQRMAELEDQFQTGQLSLESYNNAALAAVEALVKADPAAQKLIETQKVQIEVTDKAVDSYTTMLAQYDPMVAATQEYNAAIVQLNLNTAALNLTEEQRIALEKKITENYKNNIEEIEKTKASMEGLALRMKDSAFSAFESWIDSAVQGTYNLKESLVDLTKQLVAMAAKMLIFKALTSSGYNVNGLFGMTAAMGGYGDLAIPQGIYMQPTFFKVPGSGFKRYASGGVFAEAGPEAIMPLARTSSGKLGITAEAMAPVVNVYNQATADGYQAATATNTKGQVDVVISRIIQDVTRGGNRLSKALDRASLVR